MKNGKSPRYDEIYAQAFRFVDIKIITDLFNKIYKTGQIPKDWMKSTFVVLLKKNQAKSRGDYRLISVMSHVLKTFLRVLHARLYSKCEELSGEPQFDFKKGLGTREALFSMKILLQRTYNYRKDIQGVPLKTQP